MTPFDHTHANPCHTHANPYWHGSNTVHPYHPCLPLGGQGVGVVGTRSTHTDPPVPIPSAWGMGHGSNPTPKVIQ